MFQDVKQMSIIFFNSNLNSLKLFLFTIFETHVIKLFIILNYGETSDIYEQELIY